MNTATLFHSMKSARLLSLLLLACSARAATINTDARGWYDSDGFASQNNNYQTGFPQPEVESRSWFSFDLSGIVAPAGAGTYLGLFAPSNSYASINSSETLSLYDVTSTGLSNDGSDGNLAVFNDLGTGTLLGTATITGASQGSFVNILLNTAGINALNAKLGGRITFGAILGSNGGAVFNTTGTDNAADGASILVTQAVPEPSTYGLAALGGVSLAALARRRRRAR